ncbi:hypothetical protein T492DRAFT_1094141 [Pavlovales sp. CCMP2436]|nr:hypothetical protein T492DRAFT_1094141 [Pavlovales sp. CCMP2436]
MAASSASRPTRKKQSFTMSSSSDCEREVWQRASLTLRVPREISTRLMLGSSPMSRHSKASRKASCGERVESASMCDLA